jgi:hypothetical protein
VVFGALKKVNTPATYEFDENDVNALFTMLVQLRKQIRISTTA